MDWYTSHKIPAIHSPRRPGDPARLIVDSGGIRQELKWQRKYADLESIIKTTWHLSVNHTQGCAGSEVLPC